MTTSNQEDGTVGLKQWPGGQQEWDKVITNLLRLALSDGDNCLQGIFSNISPFQVREGLVVKKEELTRISGPIFERVDRAYRRLEEVHGRQGGDVCI